MNLTSTHALVCHLVTQEVYAHLVHGYEEDLEAIQRVKSQVKGTVADTSRYMDDKPFFCSRPTSAGKGSLDEPTD